MNQKSVKTAKNSSEECSSGSKSDKSRHEIAKKVNKWDKN
jgi:hypothetical protein